MLGTRAKAGIAAVGVTALALLTSQPGRASAPACGGSGGIATTCGNDYVNPFKPTRWYAGRIDMGVDYAPNRKEPLVAIGDAKVLGSERHSGWPGAGGFIWYRLRNGDHAGDVVYVAEDLKRLVPAGTLVGAGRRLATAIHPTTKGIEIGWATRDGQPRAAPCYTEGMVTNSGKEIARFLESLGAEVGAKTGAGTDEPSGRLC